MSARAVPPLEIGEDRTVTGVVNPGQSRFAERKSRRGTYCPAALRGQERERGDEREEGINVDVYSIIKAAERFRAIAESFRSLGKGRDKKRGRETSETGTEDEQRSNSGKTIPRDAICQ